MIIKILIVRIINSIILVNITLVNYCVEAKVWIFAPASKILSESNPVYPALPIDFIDKLYITSSGTSRVAYTHSLSQSYIALELVARGADEHKRARQRDAVNGYADRYAQRGEKDGD